MLIELLVIGIVVYVQFFVNVSDAEVEHYLRLYTFLNDDEIADLMVQQRVRVTVG